MDDDIRRIIREHGLLRDDVGVLARDDDLYEAGMSSHASVAVMLGLEEHFDVEFPERMLEPSVFASISAIAVAIAELRAGQAVR